MRGFATFLAVGAVTVAAAGCAGSRHAAGDPIPGHPASGRVSEVAFTYSRRFDLRSFASCSFQITGDRRGGCDRGVVVASYPLRPQPEMAAPGAHFSAKGVALELYRPPADQGLANLRLGDRSLSGWAFHPVGDAPVLPDRKPPPPEQWEAWFRVKGASYWAIAWVGAKSTRAERAALADLIESIHTRGQTPQGALPKPARQVVQVPCSGSARKPIVPDDTLAGGFGRICAQISGTKCRVWTRQIGAPASAVRERHFQLRAAFCAYARRFVAKHPRGWAKEPLPQHLVLP